MPPNRSAADVSSSLRIPFRDVDMHGHVHNAAYLCYFEAAINDFLRAFDLHEHFRPQTSGHSYHVKKVELVFDRPAHFDECVVVTAALARVGTTSLTFTGRITREPEPAPCVTASVVWVCVDHSSRRPAPLPAATRAALMPLVMTASGG